MSDKIVKVHLINPPTENPWRTRGDYIKEQKRDTIRFYLTIASLFVSIVAVSLTSYFSIQSINIAKETIVQDKKTK